MDNLVDIHNLELKDNNLIINLSSTGNVSCNVFINNQQVSTINVNGKTDIVCPLKYVFEDDLTVKVTYGEEIIEKDIHRDMDTYFTTLKRTMLGKDGYFFLVNDSNWEISQHFDENHKGLIDIEKFKKSLESKKTYLNNKGIGYDLFVIPDKSLMLRDKLPFKTNEPRRNADLLKDYVHDLKPVLTGEDYFKNDSHISYRAALKIIPYVASKLYNLDFEEVKRQVMEKVKIESKPHLGDLFINNNWSYEKDELYYKNIRLDEDTVFLKDKFEEKDIPQEFKYLSSTTSKHFYNPNSISDKKVLVLRDSSTGFLSTTLVSYFREVFLYWDHWLFNKELVDYFKPDNVIELRTERMIDRPGYPILDENYHISYPIHVTIKNFDLISKILNMTLYVKDYRQLPQNVPVTVYIDDEFIKEEYSVDGLYNIIYPLDDYEEGKHILRVDIDKDNVRRFSFQKELMVYESFDSVFENLRNSYLGIEDNIFLVNDKTNEIKQHYDNLYQSRFNLEKFKVVHNSKRSYLRDINIPYKMFILPDKSVVLNDFLPFNQFKVLKSSSFGNESNSVLKTFAPLENIKPKRIMDKIYDCAYDLKEVLDTKDYLKNDSRLAKPGFIKVVAYMLHKMYLNKSWTQYMTDLFEKIELVNYKHRGNLVTKKSWSYEEELRLKLYEVNSKDIRIKGNYEEINSDMIPFEFREFANLKSKYYKNKDSISPQRALIILDTTAENVIMPFVAYYNEVFFYFDEWYFNKDLIDWFKPHIIYEIRGERNLQNSVYQKISYENDIVIPVSIQELDFSVNENILSYEIKCLDLKQMPVPSDCTFIIDDENITSIKLVDGQCIFKCDISNLYDGEHILKVVLNQTSKTKSKTIVKKFKK